MARKFTNYHLLVLEDIRSDPFFYKRNNLLRYKIPKDDEISDKDSIVNKVTTVWDLRDWGAFNINNSHPHLGRLNYEFYLQILHPEFEQIHKRVKDGVILKVKEKPLDWEWINKKRGIYQFGEVQFKQTGGIRRKVFIALMNTFERSPQAISIQTLHEITGIKPPRIRIEINAINTRLKVEVRIYFKGSGEGFYTLVRLPSSPHLSIQ